jgi:hypothetical protein
LVNLHNEATRTSRPATTLLHDGKISPARALAQQLLANPDLPVPIRRHLEGNPVRK